MTRPVLAARLKHRFCHLLDEQRDSIRAPHDVAPKVLGDWNAAGHALNEHACLARGEPVDGQRGHMRSSDPGRRELVPEGHEQENPEGVEGVDDPAERLKGRRIRPVDVLEQKHHRGVARDGLDVADQRFERLLPALLRGGVRRPMAAIVRQREHFGQKRCVFPRSRGSGEQRVKFVELGFGVVLARKPGRTLQMSDDRIEGAIRVLWRAEVSPQHMGLARRLLDERRSQPRLADAGLAGQQNDLALACFRPLPAPHQKAHFFVAADQGGQAACAKRFEPAPLRSLVQHAIGAHRPRDAFELERPEKLDLEQLAEQISGALRDHDAVGSRGHLQPGGQVRRVADSDALLRLSRPNDIADDDDSRRDPNPHMQRLLRCGLQLRSRFGDRQPRPHRLLGVVLMGVRIAEIGEHPIAQETGDEAAVGLDQARAAFLVGADHAAQVFRIEPGRERGRSHQIAEHDRQLTALGGVGRRAGSRRRGDIRISREGAETGDRPEQAFAMAEDDAELFEVGVGQVGQDFGVDAVVAERRFVLAEPEASEPVPHVHSRVFRQFRGHHHPDRIACP